MVAFSVLTDVTLPPPVWLLAAISVQDSESLPRCSTLRFQGEVLGDHQRGGLSLLSGNGHGLIAHQERPHPEFRGPCLSLQGLAVNAEPPSIAFEAVGHLLEPPPRPLCKLFVLQLGCLLRRSSRVLRGASTLPRAPRCRSPQLCPGQQGVEHSLGVVACAFVKASITSIDRVVFMPPSTHSSE